MPRPPILSRSGFQIEALLSPDGFDQNRAYAGLERPLGADFAAELGYCWSYQRRYHCPAYFDRHVLRLTASKELNRHHVPPPPQG